MYSFFFVFCLDKACDINLKSPWVVLNKWTKSLCHRVTELNSLLTDLGLKVLSAQNAQYILRAEYVYNLQGTIRVYL